MCQQIRLKTGELATVDDQDFELVSRYPWHRSTQYAASTYRLPGSRRKYKRFMHQLVLPCPPSIEPDHVNGDGLDNRRENLRPATRIQNARNRGPQKNNTTGYKGVNLKKATGRYTATIQVERKALHLGYHDTAEDAARAYDRAARHHHGQFARLNFPQEERSCSTTTPSGTTHTTRAPSTRPSNWQP